MLFLTIRKDPQKKGVDMKREDDIVCQFIGDHVIGKRKKLKNLKKLNSIPYYYTIFYCNKKMMYMQTCNI